MTLRTNARVAGVTYLVYFGAGIGEMLTGAQSQGNLFALLSSFCALVLGVTLYAITRDQDPDLALVALACRILEAAPGPGTVYFAAGSTIFAWLLLRGRLIPIWLARCGVVGSGLLVIVLPMQRAGLLGGSTNWSSSIGWLPWIPAMIFELTLAVWLIVRGVAAPSQGQRP